MSESVTPWTVVSQVPQSIGGYWSGLPFPPPGDLPDPRIKPAFPGSLALAAGSFTTELPGYLLLPWATKKGSTAFQYN